MISGRRKQYIVEKRLQVSMILRSAAVVFISSSVVMLMFAYLTSTTMTMAYDNAELRLERTPLALMPEIFYALAAGLAVGVIAIFISHRIGGPLHHTYMHIDGMLQGDLTALLRFRKKDEIKKLADMMNYLSADLKKRIRAIKEHSMELDRAAGRLHGIQDPAVGPILDEIDKAARELREETEFFKTDE